MDIDRGERARTFCGTAAAALVAELYGDPTVSLGQDGVEDLFFGSPPDNGSGRVGVITAMQEYLGVDPLLKYFFSGSSGKRQYYIMGLLLLAIACSTSLERNGGISFDATGDIDEDTRRQLVLIAYGGVCFLRDEGHVGPKVFQASRVLLLSYMRRGRGVFRW